MAWLTPGLEVFMSPRDESAFLTLIKAEIPSVEIIEQCVWEGAQPRIIDLCAIEHVPRSSDFSLIDTDIQSLSVYAARCVHHHPSGCGYVGDWVGPGLLQFLRSRPARYAAESLANGCISASLDPGLDRLTHELVKRVWRILRANSEKVYSVDRLSHEIAEKHESKFLAWPDAARVFDGSGGAYLTNTASAYFVARL
ncbi:hypothetical protein [Stenotrophomonas maltophilia]|uniref:hypothetical protein n=1 Tax=Stenotrophomonas maltophilia TaxID=40324 RepID=UPI002895AFFB|nr:hypothetical protein [Stenotrophomonas maltophilia]MDT3487596.1 hypothetical protein [Stenotrophomonas maltophilia]